LSRKIQFIILISFPDNTIANFKRMDTCYDNSCRMGGFHNLFPFSANNVTNINTFFVESYALKIIVTSDVLKLFFYLILNCGMRIILHSYTSLLATKSHFHVCCCPTVLSKKNILQTWMEIKPLKCRLMAITQYYHCYENKDICWWM
jgi:hypothetical protein